MANTGRLSQGQIAKLSDHFCPFGAVASYPYRYMRGDDLDTKRVSEGYFAGGRFRLRGWNM